MSSILRVHLCGIFNSSTTVYTRYKSIRLLKQIYSIKFVEIISSNLVLVSLQALYQVISISLTLWTRVFFRVTSVFLVILKRLLESY